MLEVLVSRITPGETEDLAARLPGPLGDFPAESGPERPGTAEWDAGAVLSTTAGAVSGGELDRVLSRLPSGYAVLFGKPELSD